MVSFDSVLTTCLVCGWGDCGWELPVLTASAQVTKLDAQCLVVREDVPSELFISSASEGITIATHR